MTKQNIWEKDCRFKKYAYFCDENKRTFFSSFQFQEITLLISSKLQKIKIPIIYTKNGTFCNFRTYHISF